MKRLLLLLSLAACTVEQTAFETEETESPLSTCAEAFVAADGTACALTAPCARPAVVNPLCCRLIAFCADGKLVHERACDPGCVACETDVMCPFGEAICELDHCLPCPPTDACKACPDGWEHRMRNGCATCDCAPKSQCRLRDGCGERLFCYAGAFCAPGCAPGDLGCCANVCALAEPHCPEPAPFGCSMRCPEELGCTHCIASHCECANGKWLCKPACAEVESVCVFAP